MNELTVGLLGALLATNQPMAVSNLLQNQAGVSVNLAVSSEDQELREVMMADDTALEDISRWILEYQTPTATNLPPDQLHQKVKDRIELVRAAYGRFLQKHPNNAKGYLAYGSFLDETGNEEAAKTQYLNAKQLNPTNPAVWNQLANYYGHNGELTNAFAHYAEAIRLEPDEPVYYQNLATTVYLYRKDAREYYHLTEQQVFDKSLALYRQAMALSPDSLPIAVDYAQSYYGIRPLRTNDALSAWTNAFKLCLDENEREGIQLHLARVKISAGLFDEAQGHLDYVTNRVFADQRQRLERSLNDRKNSTAQTNDTSSITPLHPAPEAQTNPPLPQLAP